MCTAVQASVRPIKGEREEEGGGRGCGDLAPRGGVLKIPIILVFHAPYFRTFQKPFCLPRCCARMIVRTHLCIGERVCAPTSLDKDQNGNLVVSCASLPLEMRERNLFMGRLRNLPTGTGEG